jgi:hypothetical protein
VSRHVTFYRFHPNDANTERLADELLAYMAMMDGEGWKLVNGTEYWGESDDRRTVLFWRRPVGGTAPGD